MTLAPNKPKCILNPFKHVLVYYTAITQFSTFSKNSLEPLQKINPPHNTTPLLRKFGLNIWAPMPIQRYKNTSGYDTGP